MWAMAVTTMEPPASATKAKWKSVGQCQKWAELGTPKNSVMSVHRLLAGQTEAGGGVEVVEVRSGALLGPQDVDAPSVADRDRDVTVGVAEVAEAAAQGRAGLDASGQAAFLEAVAAEVALRHVAGRVHEARPVRACGDAGRASDALLGVDVDDAVLGDVAASRGADRYARRVLAVQALLGPELDGQVGESADGGVADPQPVVSDRHLVLHRASDGAGRAADAGREVDGHGVAFHTGFLSLTSAETGGYCGSGAPGTTRTKLFRSPAPPEIGSRS